MPDMNDTLHCRCSRDFKLQMQAAAQKAGISEGLFIRQSVWEKIQQVEKEMTTDERPEPVSNPEPTE